MEYSVAIAMADRAYRIEVRIGELVLFTPQRFFSEASANAAKADVEAALDRAVNGE